jgi:hypothetical protein
MRLNGNIATASSKFEGEIGKVRKIACARATNRAVGIGEVLKQF